VNPGNKNNDSYKVTGIMSGTSLDGVDIAFCTFNSEDGKWNYSIRNAETIPYPEEWRIRLANLENKSALEFVKTDADYGHFLGRTAKAFHLEHNLKPDFIASHGHTIFHQPALNFTSQIGKGSAIAAETGIPVVCDFRSTDVALGGQGAPLVPVGDKLLFGEYTYCLNLGGFANISYTESGKRIAFDICPANIVLNYLASFLHKDYDENGMLARHGILHQPLLDELNGLEFYRREPPKSLGKEWVLSEVHPLLEKYSIPVEDKLRTFVEHIVQQVSETVKSDVSFTLLLTGGGACNDFLAERIREKTSVNVVIPDPLTLNFKEALIFAFLGVLRWREEVNCLKSVTGARCDNSGGAIYLVPEG
jgi:anhydro-N-acetylmuramic acid kinase